MFKLLRELSRTDAFGFPAAFDDERNSSFSGFSERKSSVTITRRATIRDVNDQRSCKTQVLCRLRRLGLEVIIEPRLWTESLNSGCTVGYVAMKSILKINSWLITLVLT